MMCFVKCLVADSQCLLGCPILGLTAVSAKQVIKDRTIVKVSFTLTLCRKLLPIPGCCGDLAWL